MGEWCDFPHASNTNSAGPNCTTTRKIKAWLAKFSLFLCVLGIVSHSLICAFTSGLEESSQICGKYCSRQRNAFSCAVIEMNAAMKINIVFVFLTTQSPRARMYFRQISVNNCHKQGQISFFQSCVKCNGDSITRTTFNVKYKYALVHNDLFS